MCRGKGVIPLPEVTSVLQQQSSTLTINSSTKLSEADIFCISRVLEENFPFLLELCLSGQTISSSTINILSQGLKSNHILKKITISSVSFENPSLFYKIPEALTLNEALSYVDLSGNSLPDNTSNALLELLGVLPGLKSLNVSYNQLESIQWGNILAVNNSLEYLFIDYNNLNYASISNLLESLLLNRTLKVLSIVGNQRNEDFLNNCAKLLAKVLKDSGIQSLAVDLNEFCKGLEELGQVLFEFNNELMEIPTLEEVSEPGRQVRFIWACLKANRWIWNKLQDPSADLDIDEDFQEILEEKLTRLKEEETVPRIKIEENVEVPIIDTPQFSSHSSSSKFNLDMHLESVPLSQIAPQSSSQVHPHHNKSEEDLIAQAYNSPREDLTEDKSLLSTSLFNDSPRNFTYSESSKSGTPNLESPRVIFEKDNLKLVQRYIRTYEDRFVSAIDSVKQEFSKEIQHLIQRSADSHSQTEKLARGLVELEDLARSQEKKNLAALRGLEKGIEIIENRVCGLEKGEKFRVLELNETKGEISGLRENLKDLNGKVEKFGLDGKLQMNSLKKTVCKKQELNLINEKVAGLSMEMQNFNLNISMIDGNTEKIKNIVSGLQRSEKVLMKKKEEMESMILDVKQKLSHFDEKIDDFPNISNVSMNLQKEIDNKITKLELRLWDSLESESSKESKSTSLKTFDKKISILDEKISKVYDNLMDHSKTLTKLESLRISERLDKLEKENLQQNIKKIQNLSIQEVKKPLKPQNNPETIRSQSSLKPNYSSRTSPFHRPPSSNGLHLEDNNKDYSAKSEDKDIHFLFQESRKKLHEDVLEYLPGEAESIVLSAIIDKANKNRTPSMRKSCSTLTLMPNPQTTTAKSSAGFKRFNEEIMPSPELQESLKQRGINF